MGLYVWKFPFRKILTPLAKALKNVHPDAISYVAVIVAFFTGMSFYFSGSFRWLLLLAAGLIFLRMILNTLDGVMAIARGNLRPEGEIVNALPDRYSDIFLMLGITFSAYCNVYIGALATISVLLVSYAGMLGKAIGVDWQHQGPLGKVERLLLLIIASLGQYFSGAGRIRLYAWFEITWIELCLLWFILAAQITVFNRVKGMLKEIKEKDHVR
jgi:archaetidylinositol phosphate synthase